MVTQLIMTEIVYDPQYYIDSFNARRYLQLLYGLGSWDEEKVAKSAAGFCFKSFNTFLSQCEKGQGRLLDMGTGPCLANIIPAALQFKQIYATDFSPSGRDELEKWRTGQPDAIDWTEYFKYAARLNGQPPENWRIYERSLRKALVAVWPCDITKEDPLAQDGFSPVDVLTQSFMVESVVKDAKELHQSIRRMSQYLKDGGTFVTADCVDASVYRVDEKDLYICNLSEEDYIRALDNNDFGQFEVVRASEVGIQEDQEHSNIGDDIVIKAVKRCV